MRYLSFFIAIIILISPIGVDSIAISPPILEFGQMQPNETAIGSILIVRTPGIEDGDILIHAIPNGDNAESINGSDSILMPSGMDSIEYNFFLSPPIFNGQYTIPIELMYGLDFDPNSNQDDVGLVSGVTALVVFEVIGGEEEEEEDGDEAAAVIGETGGTGGGSGYARIAPDPPELDEEFLADNQFTYTSGINIFGPKHEEDTAILVDGNANIAEYPYIDFWTAHIPLHYGINTTFLHTKDDGEISSSTVFRIIRRLIGDVNGSRLVDDYDLSKFVRMWNSTDKEGDFNIDEYIDDYDFSMMVSNWGNSIK
jgi:hypothetical protein